MNSFIRYLYEYEHGKRVRNIGFVKVERSDNKCVIHIHGKGLHLQKGDVLELYLFYVDGKQCIGMLQGVIEHADPSIHYRLEYVPEDVGGNTTFEAVQGIILRGSGNKKYAVVWDDMPINVDEMRIKEKNEVRAEEVTSEPIVAKEDEEIEVEVQSATCECPVYKKISRQDIETLPRNEWKLANNSFLLHGYHNYQHLILIEDEGALFIGVPGVYHNKEEAAAKTFGFSQFHRVKDGEIALAAAEINANDDFGYWCRQVQKK